MTLTQISAKANVLVQQLGMGHAMPTRDMDAYPDARSLEITEVLDEIEQRLNALETIRGPKRDQALERIENYAAPYALALFYEVIRLDSATLHLPGRNAALLRRRHRNSSCLHCARMTE